MAIANFFDRALMSASQALRGIEPSAIQERLESQIIELLFDDTAAAATEGRAALDLAVRLLVRLYPNMRLTPLGTQAAALQPQLEELAQAINPAIDLSLEAEASVRLVFGATAVPEGPNTIYAGSDAWLAKVSDKGPQGTGASDIPFGAGGAACLGAANVFRAVFSDALEVPRLDEDAVLSLFDFTTGVGATHGPVNLDVVIGETPLVGVGAIGNGAIWALAKVPGLKGRLHLVDHEKVELSNLQRYVLTTQHDIDRVKVTVAHEAVAAGNSRLETTPFVTRWDEYVEGRGHCALSRAVAALDSAADRIAVQAALPRRTLNAWTQAGDLGVSRHGFLEAEACLACLYIPQRQKPNEDQIIAQALGLPIEPAVLLHPLRELLVNGQPVGEAFVRETTLRLGLPADALLRFAGEPLRQFYSKAVCGGAILQPDRTKPPIEAPLAFQSALAGVMLAAELVAEAGELRSERLKTKTVIDLRRPLGKRLNFQIAKPAPTASAKCICQDADFQTAYRMKHDMPPSSSDGNRRGKRAPRSRSPRPSASQGAATRGRRNRSETAPTTGPEKGARTSSRATAAAASGTTTTPAPPAPTTAEGKST